MGNAFSNNSIPLKNQIEFCKKYHQLFKSDMDFMCIVDGDKTMFSIIFSMCIIVQVILATLLICWGLRKYNRMTVYNEYLT